MKQFANFNVPAFYSFDFYLLSIIFQDAVREEIVKRTIGGRAEANFAIFLSREMAAAMRSKDKIFAAQISIPCHDSTAQTHAVDVGTDDLRKIHTLLCY